MQAYLPLFLSQCQFTDIPGTSKISKSVGTKRDKRISDSSFSSNDSSDDIDSSIGGTSGTYAKRENFDKNNDSYTSSYSEDPRKLTEYLMGRVRRLRF